jgi:hypothetical protein
VLSVRLMALLDTSPQPEKVRQKNQQRSYIRPPNRKNRPVRGGCIGRMLLARCFSERKQR